MRIVIRTKKLQILIFALGMAIPSFVSAQTTQRITLADAVSKGIKESKTLKLDKSKIDLALSKYNESKDAMLPDVKLALGYTYLSDLESQYRTIKFGPEPIYIYKNNNYTSRLSVTEPVFVGFREKYAEKATQLLMEATKLDVEKDKDEVAINIINSYFNLYKAQSAKKQIDENIKQINQRLAEVEDGFKNGTAIQNDVLRVKLQLSNTQLAQIDAANNISIVNFNMDIMLGLPVNTTIEIDSASMFATKTLKSSDDYIKDAITQRMEIKANKTRIQAAETGIEIAKGSYYPTIGVGADAYYSNPNQRYFPLVEGFKPTWDAGINISWSITNMFTNKHQIAEAQANLDQSRAANDVVSDQIKMEVNSCYTAYVESLKKIDVAKLSVSQAEENYRTLTSRYNNHFSLLSDLLDANTLLLQSKINESMANADAELAYKKLLKATGQLTVNR